METITLLYPYIAAVCLLTFILLKYVFKNTGETERFLVSVISGLILGFVWYVWISAPLAELIVSYLAAVGLYHTLVKRFMAWIGHEYNDGKGVI